MNWAGSSKAGAAARRGSASAAAAILIAIVTLAILIPVGVTVAGFATAEAFLLELQPGPAAPDQNRPDELHLRAPTARCSARSRPSRTASPSALRRRRRGCRRRPSPSRTGASTTTAASTTRASRARSGRTSGAEGRPGRLDDHPAARPQPLPRPAADARAARSRRPASRSSCATEAGRRTEILDEYTEPASTTAATPYGVEAAAQTYFSKPAKDLNLAQAALIAGLPQAPSRLRPVHRPGRARSQRRNEVLQAMLDERRHHADQYRPMIRDRSAAPRARGRSTRAIREPLLLQLRARPADRAVRRRDRPRRAGCASTRRSTRGSSARRAGGPRHAAEQTDPAAARRLDRPAERRDPGDDRRDAGQEAEPVQPRRAGAAPAGLDVQDVRPRRRRSRRGSTRRRRRTSRRRSTTSRPRSSAPWDVHTYDDTYLGPTTIERATPALGQLGVRAAHARRRARERRRDGAQARRRESTLRRDGDTCPRSASERVGGLAARDGLRLRDARGGRDLLEADRDPEGRAARAARSTRTPGWGKPDRVRVIEDGVAAEVTKILGENIQYGTAAAANIGRPDAAKTGTTENHADAWLCGYTPNLTTTVWMGYPQARGADDGRPRHRRRRRHLPGPDLAPVHGAGARRACRVSTSREPKHAADLQAVRRAATTRSAAATRDDLDGRRPRGHDLDHRAGLTTRSRRPPPVETTPVLPPVTETQPVVTEPPPVTATTEHACDRHVG